MPQAAMAAGSIAGSAAGGLLKKALGGDEPETPQVDPAKALQFYTTGLNSQTSYLNQGLKYYQSQVAQAKNEVTNFVNQANLTLQPMSTASFNAMNEYMRMLGMDPITGTSQTAARVRQAGYGDIAGAIEAADQIVDPVQRQQAKQNVINQINTSIAGEAAPDVKALQDQLAQYQDIYKRSTSGDIAGMNQANMDANALLYGVQGSPSSEGATQIYKSIPIIEQQIAAKQAAFNQGKEARYAALAPVRDEFAQNYSAERQAGYTGEQVAAKVAATPGYEFQLNQGTQAITRQQAAAGMLNSGQTGIALAEYGQNLAQNAYAGYMNNLSNIVNQGSGATMQIAANQAGLGTALAGLSQGQGQAGLGTYGQIGQAFADWGQLSGQTQYDADKFNTGLLFQAQQNDKNRQLQQQQNNIQGGYLQLARDKQAYGMYQNQQVGQGFMAAQNAASGQTYQRGGLTFTNWGAL